MTWRSEATNDRKSAIDFGKRYGWTLSRNEFSLPCLAEHKHHDGRDYWKQRHEMWGYFHDQFDHPYFYKDGSRRAIAIAAHLYNFPKNEATCREVAAHFGLRFEHITDYPSWHFPGHTQIILWRSAKI